MSRVPIEQVERINEANGFYFFSLGARRFFSSRVASYAWKSACGEKWYFVTSERLIPSSGISDEYPRMWSVRRMGTDGRVETIGEFQGYSTRRDADRTAKRLAGGIPD